MNTQLRKALNLILFVLFIYGVYLVIEIPQPYGKIALAILAITFLFNLIKKKFLSISLYVIGLAGTAFVYTSAYSFISFTNAQRSKFDIPTEVNFENTNFQTALLKAKKENKHVFVDFYTGWCAPCLSFTKNVLTDKEVGHYMNKAFINLKYDAEKGEGRTLAKKYKIRGYPTILILTPNGKILEDVGGGKVVPQKDDMIRVSKKYMQLPGDETN